MAPNSERRPPKIHARYTVLDRPVAAIISRGTRKIPLPMMIPITMEVAWAAFKTRSSS
jgi:hypothetical protein